MKHARADRGKARHTSQNEDVRRHVSSHLNDVICQHVSEAVLCSTCCTVLNSDSCCLEHSADIEVPGTRGECFLATAEWVASL